MRRSLTRTTTMATLRAVDVSRYRLRDGWPVTLLFRLPHAPATPRGGRLVVLPRPVAVKRSA